MSNYEDVYMQCPFCGRQIMKSATDAEIEKWIKFHITEKSCQKVGTS